MEATAKTPTVSPCCFIMSVQRMRTGVAVRPSSGGVLSLGPGCLARMTPSEGNVSLGIKQVNRGVPNVFTGLREYLEAQPSSVESGYVRNVACSTGSHTVHAAGF
jgi:hypothetical protein